VEELLTLPPDEILLRWFNHHLLAAGSKRKVHNFGDDIKDGENYTILLHQLAPVECPLTPLETADLNLRAEQILHNAGRIGVRRYLNAHALVTGNPRLNLAFVANLFNIVPGLTPREKALPQPIVQPLGPPPPPIPRTLRDPSPSRQQQQIERERQKERERERERERAKDKERELRQSVRVERPREVRRQSGGSPPFYSDEREQEERERERERKRRHHRSRSEDDDEYRHRHRRPRDNDDDFATLALLLLGVVLTSTLGVTVLNR